MTFNRSTSFQVMAALESKDELQRIRMAQILHDLHALAAQMQESTEVKRKEKTAMGQIFKHVRNWTIKPQKSKPQQSKQQDIPTNASTTQSPSIINSSTDEDLLSRFRFRHELLRTKNNTINSVVSTSPTSALVTTDNNNNKDEDSYLTPSVAQRMIQAIMEGKAMGRQPLLSLLDSSRVVLKRDDTLIRLTSNKSLCDKHNTATTTATSLSPPNKDTRVMVVGDLHGSLSSLQHVLDLIGDTIGKRTGDPDDHETCTKEKTNKDGQSPRTTSTTTSTTTVIETTVVFNGDFVDRGDESLEVMSILLLLKLAYPNHVYLLRGNHEDVLVSSAYGFQDQVIAKFGEEHARHIWHAIHSVFCALPIGVLTDTAVIFHGGLPSADFTLDELEAITTEERCEIITMINQTSKVGQLLQGILWSDPSSNENGIHPNTTRSIGVFYGPDVVASFLKKHGLKYLVRSHEVAEQGATVLDCGDGYEVVTVFSQSEYPNGEGSNLGAFMTLHGDGKDYELVRFSRNTKFNARHRKRMKQLSQQKNLQGSCDDHVEDDHYHDCTRLNNDNPYVHTLKTLISSNKSNLSKAFNDVAPCGTATLGQWADIMARVLELPDIPWMVLLPSLVPETNDAEELQSGTIDWRAFLALYKSSLSNNAVHSHPNSGCNGDIVASSSRDNNDIAMEIMHANHSMLMKVYKFLDFNGDGTINSEEFLKAIELLNKRLPEDRQLNDAQCLFDFIDVDGSGKIDYQEFEQVFKVM